MSNQFPDWEDELSEEALALHQRLLADGRSWRKSLPPTSHLKDAVTAMAHSTSAPQPHIERPTIMHTPSPVPSRGRSPWLTLTSVAIVVFIAIMSVALFRGITHQTQGKSVAPTVSVSAVACVRTNFQDLFTHIQLNKLSMVSPTEGWAVGAVVGSVGQYTQGSIWHLKGCQWQEYHTSFSLANSDLTNIAMLSADDGWISGTLFKDPQHLDPANIHQALVFLRFSQGQWQQVNIPAAESMNSGTLNPVSADEAWILGDTFARPATGGLAVCCGQLLHQQQGVWSKVALPQNLAQREFVALGTVGSNDIWFFADDANAATLLDLTPRNQEPTQLVHYHNGTWDIVLQPKNIAIMSIQMLSATDGWATGFSTDVGNPLHENPIVLHFDGKQWQNVTINNPPESGYENQVLRSIGMLPNGDGWITGDAANSDRIATNPLFYHCHAGQCRRSTISFPIYLAGATTISEGSAVVTMVSPKDGWAIVTGNTSVSTVDVHTFIFHYDGTSWQLEQA